MSDEVEKAREWLALKEAAMRECACGVCAANLWLAQRRLARALGGRTTEGK